MGVTEQAISMAMNTTIGRRYVQSLDELLTQEYATAQEAIQAASMRAVQIVGGLAENSPSDTIKLKAAADLLDRNPATSKTQRVAVESFTIGAKDAKAIAESLVAARGLREQFAEAAEGDYIRVKDSTAPLALIPAEGADHKLQAPQPNHKGVE
jgi:hypothetical protein